MMMNRRLEVNWRQQARVIWWGRTSMCTNSWAWKVDRRNLWIRGAKPLWQQMGMGTDASTVDFKNRRSWLEKSSEILTEPSSANMKKAESKHLKAYNRKWSVLWCGSAPERQIISSKLKLQETSLAIWSNLSMQPSWDNHHYLTLYRCSP